MVQIGWDVHTSLEEGRSRGIEDHIWSSTSDAQQLAAARDLGRILFSFDDFKGKDGAEVAAELKLNGGRIILVSVGPEQPPYRALAKLLWHYDEWTEFLSDQDGVVLLRDLRQTPELYTVDDYFNRKVISATSRGYFDEYVIHWDERQLPKPTPGAVLTPEEQLLTHPPTRQAVFQATDVSKVAPLV